MVPGASKEARGRKPLPSDISTLGDPEKTGFAVRVFPKTDRVNPDGTRTVATLVIASSQACQVMSEMP